MRDTPARLTTGVSLDLMAVRSIQMGMPVMTERWEVSKGVENAAARYARAGMHVLCKQRTEHSCETSFPRCGRVRAGAFTPAGLHLHMRRPSTTGSATALPARAYEANIERTHDELDT